MTLTVLPSGQIYYAIEKSLRFRAAASARLSRTPAVAGNRQIWTWSGWVKRSTLDDYQSLFSVWKGTTADAFFAIRFEPGNNLAVFDYTNPAFEYMLTTSQVFRDTASWYHIVVAVDTTQATASNRVKIYVNGQQVTAFATATYPALNYITYTNNTTVTYFGASAHLAGGGTIQFFDGYIAEVNFISGLARDASYFGEISPKTNSWSPKKYTGTYGTTGFYLKFTDSSSLTSGSNVGLGKDFSGNNNYFNTTGISITSGATYDSMLDVPTLTSSTASNYTTLNSLSKNASLTIQNAALTATSASTNVGCASTISVTAGKWYWEARIVTKNGADPIVGVVNTDRYWDYGFVGNESNGWGYGGGGFKFTAGIGVAYGTVTVAGDIVGVALNLDAKTIEFYKNGVSQGIAYTNLPAGSYTPAISVQNNTISINFGQQPFAYSTPTGFKRVSTFNLPDPLIKKSEQHMTTTIYSGTGLPRTFVNAGKFQPGLIWAKSRTEAGYSTIVNDSIRGASKNLYTNLTNAEDSNSYITSLNSDGFSVGGTAGIGAFAQNYVAWQWKTSLASTTNTAGSLTSTIRANLTAGISVVRFTLASTAVSTVGHGLNVAPTMIIVKISSTTGNWLVYHNYLGPTKYILLNAQAGPVTTAGSWNNTAPTSSVFTLGNFYQTGNTAIAYCFSEVEGYSKFGSYIGNGNVNGAFVYTGFRPAFVMIKRADATISNWTTLDSTRSQFNVTNAQLSANLAGAESINNDLDFLSNGFKARIVQNNMNAASAPYIYMAFAESPFKYSNAR